MKKTAIIIAVIAAVLAIVICTGVYLVANSPEYALYETVRDVSDRGLEGLGPHLTGDALSFYNKLVSLSDNKLISSFIDLLGGSDSYGVLLSKIQEIQWGVGDILRSRGNARVVISFDYRDKITGTIELSMVKEGGDWKISGAALPEFEKLDL